MGERLKGWRCSISNTADDHVDVGGLEVPAVFDVSAQHADGRMIEMTCGVDEPGRIVVRHVGFYGFPETDFESLNVPMLRDFAAMVAAVVPPEDRASAAAELHRRSRRNAITDELIERTAELYKVGGVKAVVGDLHVEERQAWRYVTEAIDRGLVEPRKRGRPQKGVK